MITVDRDALLPALQAANRISPSKHPVPIVTHLLVAGGAGAPLTVVGTDLDGEVEARVSRADIEAPLSLAVPAKQMVDLVSGAPAGSVIRLEAKEGHNLLISVGKARYRLPGLPGEDFPRLVMSEDMVSLPVPGAELAAALTSTAWAQATDEKTEWTMCGTRLRGLGGQLAVEALNRANYARRLAPWPEGVEAEALGLPIIPRHVVGDIAKLAADVALVELRLSQTLVALSAGEVTLASKLIDGRWGPIDTKIEALPAPMHTVTVGREALSGALSRLSTVLSGRKTAERSVTIDLTDPERLNITARDSEGGDGLEEVEAAVTTAEGAEIPMEELKVQPDGLVKVLASMEGRAVRLLLYGLGEPFRVEPAEEARAGDFCLCAPMRG